MKLILRADDLGFSEAVNYGIIKSIKDGLITTVGLMTNMASSSVHGARLIKEYQDISLGQHTNISLGYPLTDPKEIPSLVDQNGVFLTSSVYRSAQEDFVVYEEALLEVEAQLKKYIELIGKTPEYIDGHAVASNNFFKAIEHVAVKYNILFVPINFSRLNNSAVKQCLFPKAINGDYDVKTHIYSQIENLNKEQILHLIFHPGYIDEFVMTHSTFNLLRCREVDFLCSVEFKQYITQKEIELISYRDI